MKRTHLALTPKFLQYLGLFHTSWATFDLEMDYAIGHFLRIPARDAHIIGAGMQYGRKIRLVTDLIARSSHPKRSELIKALKVTQESKRDKLTHSFILSDESSATFVERSNYGQFKSTPYRFTLQQFADHVAKFVAATKAFHDLLGAPQGALQAFSEAAYNDSNNATTSPQPPSATTSEP